MTYEFTIAYRGHLTIVAKTEEEATELAEQQLPDDARIDVECSVPVQKSNPVDE